MDLLTTTDVLTLLGAAAGENHAKWAHSKGIGPGYLHDVLHRRREPGPKILEALGLERAPVIHYYRRKDSL